MLEDRILLMRAKRGDQGAFDQIYEKYLDCLLTMGMGLLGDRALAADVVQDVFVKFVEDLDGFELRGSLRAYLAMCVTNKAYDQLRRLEREQRLGRRNGNVKLTGPADAMEHKEQFVRLTEVIGQLPFEQREVIMLKLHGGLSFRAISKNLGLPLGTVQSRYRYGLERMRKELNGEVEI